MEKKTVVLFKTRQKYGGFYFMQKTKGRKAAFLRNQYLEARNLTCPSSTCIMTYRGAKLSL